MRDLEPSSIEEPITSLEQLEKKIKVGKSFFIYSSSRFGIHFAEGYDSDGHTHKNFEIEIGETGMLTFPFTVDGGVPKFEERAVWDDVKNHVTIPMVGWEAIPHRSGTHAVKGLFPVDGILLGRKTAQGTQSRR